MEYKGYEIKVRMGIDGFDEVWGYKATELDGSEEFYSGNTTNYALYSSKSAVKSAKMAIDEAEAYRRFDWHSPEELLSSHKVNE